MPISIALYGLTLRQLYHPQAVELVRQHRNSTAVAQYMEHQNYITEEAQRQWFKNVYNANNLFYLIEYQQQTIGLINTAHINWDEKTGHGGIFIWEYDFLNHPISVFAVLAMMDINFEILGLQKMYAKVQKANKRAVAYNKNLGYVPIENEGINPDFQLYETTPELYFKKTSLFRKMAVQQFGNKAFIQINDAVCLPFFAQKFKNYEALKGAFLAVGFV